MNTEEWLRLIRDLEEIIEVYDRMNKVMSLGLIDRIRSTAAAFISGSRGPILDIGSGPGSMSQALIEAGYSGEIVLADPSFLMLSESLRRLGQSPLIHYVEADIEAPPFRKEAFPAAMAAFSLRDVRRIPDAIKEVRNLLKPDGIFVFLDITRPDSIVAGILASIYWGLVVPVMALASTGRLWKKYLGLLKTYLGMPRLGELLEWFEETGLRPLRVRRFFLGAATLAVLRRT